MGQTLTDNLVPVSSSSNQAALSSTAMLALPSTSGIENIPPGAILQDLVPVNPRNRPIVLADRSSDNTFMDELRDIDFSDILNEFNDNTAHKSKTVRPICRQIHRFSMAMLLLFIILPLISNS